MITNRHHVLRTTNGLTQDGIKQALQNLDGRIDEHIGVRITGGAALIMRNIRENGLTFDIDTITPSYSHKVQCAIHETAKALNLEPDWLNNDAVFSFDDNVNQADVDAYDTLLDAKYDSVEMGLDRIDVEVADLPTLTKTKALATCDIEFGFRGSKDRDDLINLLYKQGLTSIPKICTRYPWFYNLEFTPALAEVSRWCKEHQIKQTEPLANTNPSDDLNL